MARKFRVTIGGTTYNVEIEEIGAGSAPAAAAPARAAAPAAAPAPAPAAPAAAAPAPAPAAAPVTRAAVSAAGEVMKAPLPGMVVGVKVTVGQKVNVGDVVLVLEAMKMENDIAATASGEVREILVDKGTSVALGDPLVVIG